MIKAYLISAVIGMIAGGAATLGITKSVKPEIKLECPEPVCPEFKCPDQVGVDFEKVKNFKGTLKIDQHYHVNVSGDSLFRELLIQDMEAKLNQLKLARCK